MTTPRPGRRPLGSLAGNDPALNGFLQDSPEHDERRIAHKASFNALIGRQTTHPHARRQSSNIMEAPSEDSVEVGDTVSVPGGMTGVVKYLGAVVGKKGVFAGVELSREYAASGKNDGDVDGIRYFTTSAPSAGIFIASHRLSRQSSPSLSASTFPPTPTTPSFNKLDLSQKSGIKSRTPPTQSIPKFSASIGQGAKHPFSQTVGPGARAPSPQLKRPSRPSLPRPESPMRKPPNLQPTPVGRGSVRGVRPSGGGTPSTSKVTKPSTPAAARSPSRAQSRQGPSQFSPAGDSTPTPSVRPKMSMRGLGNQRPSSSGDETNRLRKELEDRDKQLKEQAVALAEMESNLAEVQSLVSANESHQASSGALEAGTENADTAELRTMLKTRQQKIDSLTKEFDQNRADFRSTIDALETAATATEQIYEEREKEALTEKQKLLRELEKVQQANEDVAQFQEQYKQFEEAVAELEEAVEAARRGEAEAKGESEFLHGEVERVRLELKREREKAGEADTSSQSRELTQRDNEIRGLKGIIANLTSSGDNSNNSPPKSRSNSNESADAEKASTTNTQLQTLQRERSELKQLIDRQSSREEELERENARLRSANGMPNNYHNYHAPNGHSSSHSQSNHRPTDSDPIAPPLNRNSATSTTTAFRSSLRNSNSASFNNPQQSSGSRPTSGNMASRPKSGSGAAPILERDADDVSTTESSLADVEGLWCELCEVGGHDILTCGKMFGQDGNAHDSRGDGGDAGSAVHNGDEGDGDETILQAEAPGRSLTEKEKTKSNGSFAARSSLEREEQQMERQPGSDEATPPVLPVGDGPAPGKESGRVDMSRWCAMCERDGHESVDCPFEEY